KPTLPKQGEKSPHRSLLMRRLQQPRHDGGHPLPAFGFRGELLASGSSQRIKFCPPVVLARPPLRRDPALLLDAQQRRIEGALIEVQHVVRDLLNALGNAVAVLAAKRVERL